MAQKLSLVSGACIRLEYRNCSHSFRTLLYDHNPLTNTRLSPGRHSFFDLAAAFLHFIAYQLTSQSTTWSMSECSSGIQLSPTERQESLNEDQESSEDHQVSSTLEVFLGNVNSEFAIAWDEETDIRSRLKRGKRHLLSLCSQFATCQHIRGFL